MVASVFDKTFKIDFNINTVDDILIERFESELTLRGFRMDKNSKGFYISELTQSAWLGFVLCLSYSYPQEESEMIRDKRDNSGDDKNTFIEDNLTIENENKKIQSSFADCDSDGVYDNDIDTLELLKRSFHKVLYPQKNEATKKATVVSKDKCIPMWIHPANGEEGWHISSHGFAISRRPDIPVTMSMLDERQIFYGFAPSDISEKMQPSAVARVAYSGSVFSQNSEYFSENILMEWLREQSDPALVISIEKNTRDERSERRTHIQDTIKEMLDCSSYYRWITRDTVVIAISDDKYDYSSAREKVQNPHWILKTMSWPNTFILKERIA